MSIKTRLRSMQKSLIGREMALYWLKLSQQRGGFLEYWNNAEFQAWPSETEEGALLYYLAFEVNTSVVLAFHAWREVASWAALLGLSMIEATSEGKTVVFATIEDLPERWSEKLRNLYADILAYEEA